MNQNSSEQEVQQVPEQAPKTIVIREKKRVRGKRRGSSNKKKMPKGAKIALIVVVILVVLALIGLGVAKYLMSKAEQEMHVQPEEKVQTVEYDGTSYVYNENVVSILVLGLDSESSDYYRELGMNRPDAQCSDVNLLVAMDTETNDVKVVAIPRDTQVDVDLYVDGKFSVTKPLQLCLAYSTDCSTKGECAENSAKSVSRILRGQPVNYYCAMDYDAVTNACDAIGGVRLTALETIPNTPITKGEEVLLQGDNALRYLKYRDCNVDGSARDRLERQQQFIKAFFSQLKGAGASKMLDVFDSISSDVNTNLSAGELGYLASCLAANQSPELEIIELKGKIKLMRDDDGEEREHVFLKDKSVTKAVLSCFYTPVE